jgi:hypothetical protein
MRVPSWGRSLEKLEILFGWVNERGKLHVWLRATGCLTGEFSDGERAAGISQRAGEDINDDGNGQPKLPPADRVAGVGWDLNYLQAEENVTWSQV